jgi:phage shock protein E
MMMALLLWTSLLLLLLVLPTALAVEILTSQEVYDGIVAGRFDVIVDVRTPEEWATGHLPNATLLDSLALFNTTGQVATPDDLPGCEGSCVILVYCRSGSRAAEASRILEEHGFAVPVYNGLGVSQWTAAGYDLVNTASTVPLCQGSNASDYVCAAGITNSTITNTMGSTTAAPMASMDSTGQPVTKEPSSSSTPPLTLVTAMLIMAVSIICGRIV